MNMQTPIMVGIISVLAVSAMLIFLIHPNSTQYCPTSDTSHCHKVIIIGAGMAGLGAAKELQSHNYTDFVILESSSSPGGRVQTSHVCITDKGVVDWNSTCTDGPKIHFDTHASYISGYVGNPIYNLATLYNNTDPSVKDKIIIKTSYPGTSVNYDENGNNATDSINNMTSIYKNFTNWKNNVAQNMVADEPLQNAIDQFSKNMTDVDKKYFAYEVSTYVGNEYGADPIDLSWKYFDKIGYRVGGDNDNVTDKVFINGFYDIITGLVNDVKPNNIRYHMVVSSINYNDNGVIVTTANNTVYYGEYVINTIPPWNMNPELFSPPIPEKKSEAIDKMSHGTLAQTYLYSTKGVFWGDKDWLNYVPPLNEKGRFTTFENMDKVNGFPMLFAFNYGTYANQLFSMNNKDLKKDLFRALSHMYPQRVSNSSTDKDPGKIHFDDIVVVYRGENETFSIVPVNFKVPDDFDLLASPLVDSNGKNRVFFAGEATTWHYPETTHGAYLTGLREANRLMTTDTGQYPDPVFQENHWRYPPKNTNDTSTNWLTYPEYVICPPNLMLVLKNNPPEYTPVCKNEDMVTFLRENPILDPNTADPTSK